MNHAGGEKAKGCGELAQWRFGVPPLKMLTFRPACLNSLSQH